MDVLIAIVAAVAAFAFGAVWYTALSQPWMAVSGVTEARQKAGGPSPFVIGLVAMVLVAGMMRHLLGTSGVGTFLVTPWVAMIYACAMRKPALTVIDGANCIVGCSIMGAVLNAFET